MVFHFFFSLTTELLEDQKEKQKENLSYLRTEMEISISLSQQSEENLFLIISLFYVFIRLGFTLAFMPTACDSSCCSFSCMASHCCHEFGIWGKRLTEENNTTTHSRRNKKKAQIRMKMKFLIETNLHNSWNVYVFLILNFFLLFCCFSLLVECVWCLLCVEEINFSHFFLLFRFIRLESSSFSSLMQYPTKDRPKRNESRKWSIIWRKIWVVVRFFSASTENCGKEENEKNLIKLISIWNSCELFQKVERVVFVDVWLQSQNLEWEFKLILIWSYLAMNWIQNVSQSFFCAVKWKSNWLDPSPFAFFFLFAFVLSCLSTQLFRFIHKLISSSERKTNLNLCK